MAQARVRSVVYDQYKEANGRRIREQCSASAKAVPRDDIAANLTMQELLQIVRQELQAFPKDSKYGRAFELREVDDLDYPEVAAELEITADEAHHWVATARVRLRKAPPKAGHHSERYRARGLVGRSHRQGRDPNSWYDLDNEVHDRRGRAESDPRHRSERRRRGVLECIGDKWIRRHPDDEIIDHGAEFRGRDRPTAASERA